MLDQDNNFKLSQERCTKNKKQHAAPPLTPRLRYVSCLFLIRFKLAI
jgi:hypothetical protein